MIRRALTNLLQLHAVLLREILLLRGAARPRLAVRELDAASRDQKKYDQTAVCLLPPLPPPFHPPSSESGYVKRTMPTESANDPPPRSHTYMNWAADRTSPMVAVLW